MMGLSNNSHNEHIAVRRAYSLTCQVVDELSALVPVLAQQRLSQLEHGRVDLYGAVPFEHAADGVESSLPHLRKQERIHKGKTYMSKARSRTRARRE